MAHLARAVRETGAMDDPGRPPAAAPTGAPRPRWAQDLLVLAATPTTARAAVPFLSVLGLGHEVASWHQVRPTGRRPDAILATRVEVLPGLPEVPTAVWVNDVASLRAAARRGVEVALTSRTDLLDFGAVLVPRAGVDVTQWPARSPEERAADRAAAGLPEHLAVAVDHHGVTDDITTTLALASAAVVTGPMVPVALALGTPVVTSPVTAQRLGLHAGLEVEVVAGARRADAAARDLARDPARAADLSRRGRRFAEHHLDLRHVAEIVGPRLGLGAPRRVLDLRSYDPDATAELAVWELFEPDRAEPGMVR